MVITNTNPSWPHYVLDLDHEVDRKDDQADYFAVFGEAEAKKRPFLNIGAGDWSHPLWQNHDFVQPPYDKFDPPDLNLDLSILDPLPLPDESLYLIYTSHTVEHLTDPMVQHWLSECRRVLKPGGLLRVVTPDITTAYWAYMLKDIRYYDRRYTVKYGGVGPTFRSSPGFSKKQDGIARNFLARFASCLMNPKQILGPDGAPTEASEAVDQWFSQEHPEEACDAILGEADFAKKRPNQHIAWFTGDKLARMMTDAGFDFALRSSYGQCVSPLMRNKIYFDTTRPNESLYVDAIKAHPDLGIR